MNKDSFSNTVKVEWLATDPRGMMLLEDVCFVDSASTWWVAHKYDIIDGASIPRFLWRVIGSPFVGHYRRASVIHDVHCANKMIKSKLVHKMFHEAMLADGVPKYKAKVMYNFVKWFGPRW